MSSILLIEDNPDLLENTAEILSLAGYEVLTAPDGKSGVERALANKPDLIISDIMMPKLDGFGVLHLIQRHEELADIPFIFLTAKTSRADFRKGMESGADDYITKPFSDSELLNAVESRLKKVNRIKAHADEEVKAGIEQKSNIQFSIQTLLDKGKQNHYKKKQPVFSEGNYPQYLFYVQSGKVKAYKTNEDGKELTVGLYAAGDFIGYTALLEGKTYRVSTQALEDAELTLIPKNDFFQLINSNNQLALQFIRILANNNNQKAEQMLHLAYNSLRKRVAGALLLLKAKFSAKETSDFSIQITREELANLSGTTTESLIRTLSDFRTEKLIDNTAGGIRILDEIRLSNMIN